MIINICLVISLLLAAGINQYRRAKRLEWHSDTSAFYKDFSYLLIYIFLLGMMVADLIRKL